MITKGIVEDIITPYQIKVRMPLIDGIEGSRNGVTFNNLSSAAICLPSGFSNTLQKGDIVFIGFEDNDLGKPVILGHLSREAFNSVPNCDMNILNVFSIATLPENTYIGNVTPKDLKNIANSSNNIQTQINALNDKINDILARLDKE